MKLIYAWIEEFRNIKKQGFTFDNKYIVRLSENHHQQTMELFYTIQISKNEAYFNLMEYKNIENITAIVGKNGAGKTSWLLALSELHASYETSKFLCVYAGGEENQYYFECNCVNITDFSGTIHYSEQKKIRPEASIYKVDIQNKVFKTCEKNTIAFNDVKYILIRHTTHNNTYPDANAFYSRIGRFGSAFKDRNIDYKYFYLYHKINRAVDLNHDTISLSIELDKTMKYLSENKVGLNLLPELFPKQKCLFDSFTSGHPLFKKAFIIRVIELVVKNMNFIDNEFFRSDIDELNVIAKTCDYDVEQIYTQIVDIFSVVERLHDKLIDKSYVNVTDTKLCYSDFLISLKNLVEVIPESCFNNSKKVVVPFNLIKESENLEYHMQKVLRLFSSHDVDLDYNPFIIAIDVVGLSDGYETISNIYATVDKCVERNALCKNGKIILALDEPDCYMHPEWSRRFIDDLYGVLSSEFGDYKFEIILTTHSPYILSDISSEHIMFLDNGKIQKPISETFGQNIYTMLKDSFFLDFTWGEFARKKIESVKAYLECKQQNTDYVAENMDMVKAKSIIALIGEPVIRDALEKKLRLIEPEESGGIQREIIDYYKKLNYEEKKFLIMHIILEEEECTK